MDFIEKSVEVLRLTRYDRRALHRRKLKRVAYEHQLPTYLTKTKVFPLTKHRGLINYNDVFYGLGKVVHKIYSEAVFIVLQLRLRVLATIFRFRAPSRESVFANIDGKVEERMDRPHLRRWRHFCFQNLAGLAGRGKERHLPRIHLLQGFQDRRLARTGIATKEERSLEAEISQLVKDSVLLGCQNHLSILLSV